AIIGTNATVASDIPPYAVAVGNPARVIRKRFDDETIALLDRLQWWHKPIEVIDTLLPILTTSDLQAMKSAILEWLKQHGEY
ncbi:MAG: hypothetical protein K2O37_05815, partial [Bacteroidales bacterium]|nr:hypothetical protein [Bacteroidales bacterium]